MTTRVDVITTTRHREGCKRVFDRYDQECPRCLELMFGAAPRPGWGDWKRHVEAQDRLYRTLYPHRCEQAGCGPVCTWGDW